MAVAEFRRRAERHRGAEIDAVLAAVALAVMLRDGSDFRVAHAGSYGREGGAHGAVLHERGAFDELHLLGAFDYLDAIDQVRRVHETGVWEGPPDVVEQRIGHLVRT